MSLRESLRAAREATDQAIRQRTRQIEAYGHDLEERGRQIYADSIRAARQVQARTPAEVKQLARAAAQGRFPEEAARMVVKAAAPVAKRVVAEVRTPAGRARLVEKVTQDGRAALSGAVDEASFGLADATLSGLEAIAGRGSSGGLNEGFERGMARRQAEDAYDEEHYGVARGIGQVAGVTATIAGTGAVGAVTKLAAKKIGGRAVLSAIRAADKVTRTAKMTPGGLTGLATAGGAVSGVAGQASGDVLSGQRSTLGDYVGAAAGGAAEGLVQRIPGPRSVKRSATGQFVKMSGLDRAHRSIVKLASNPVTAGGAGGATTVSAQALLNGEDLDVLDVARGARGGAIGAQVGDVAGKFGANALSKDAKEWLGERLSEIKSFASGQGSPWGRVVDDIDVLMPTVARGETPSGAGRQRWIRLPSGRFTKVDRLTNKGFAVESKMGAYARPTGNQREAIRNLPRDRYRVDHWLPADIGRILSVPAGAAGTRMSDEELY